MPQEEKKKKTDSVGVILYAFYLLMLIASVVLLVRIGQIQMFFTPDPAIAKVLTTPSRLVRTQATRGNILARDGSLLATTYPEYSLYLDCTVQADTVWNKSLGALCKGLSELFPSRSASQFRTLLQKGRQKGSRYLKLGEGLDINRLHTAQKLPILCKGKYRGGLIVEAKNKRHYPFGSISRRTIGFVRDKDSKLENKYIGLEGKYDYVLHGTDGKFWTEKTDFGHVQRFDSSYVKAVDGLDIRTTIDVDYQLIAHQALINNIINEEDLEGGCVVLMDVKTGAVRAMVNLMRSGKNRRLDEISNLAIGRRGEPGSVFKTSCLMMMLEEKHIKSLNETIPTNHGVMQGYSYAADEHIVDYERKTGRSSIPVIDGFKVSSNYMFRYLAVKNYGNRPEKYFKNLYAYKLGTPFDFDVEGLASPVLPDPKSSNWSKTDLTGAATGYAVDETPLQILCFYNAIANKGKMMQPYLVEDIEYNGEVKTKKGPVVLDGSICSRATADTLTRALRAVTEEGTAKRLKGAKCNVAGKTGTARVALGPGGYTQEGKKKQQGTFVGFFPAEDPQFSIICTVYSYLSDKDFYGGSIPAATVRNIVDKIYDIDPYWRYPLKKKEEIKEMQCRIDKIPVSGDNTVRIPDLKGLGLKDAVYILENMGMQCSYNGIGHIEEQKPEPGETVAKGSAVKIVLR